MNFFIFHLVRFGIAGGGASSRSHRRAAGSCRCHGNGPRRHRRSSGASSGPHLEPRVEDARRGLHSSQTASEISRPGTLSCLALLSDSLLIMIAVLSFRDLGARTNCGEGRVSALGTALFWLGSGSAESPSVVALRVGLE